MSELKTSLKGRLRNTDLPPKKGLMPLFEAVINSIHAIEDRGNDAKKPNIEITVIRSEQKSLQDSSDGEKINIKKADIIGFRIQDNGIGFTKTNFSSFETLDSEHKIDKGCRGIGRLLWLKAFKTIHVHSFFRGEDGCVMERSFDFTSGGISNETLEQCIEDQPIQTTVELKEFDAAYGDRSPKTLQTIAKSLLEHCLSFFLGNAPQITLRDDDETVSLHDIFEKHKKRISQPVCFDIKGKKFTITHVELSKDILPSHEIAYVAATRFVKGVGLDKLGVLNLEESLECENGKFRYIGLISGEYLDESVRPERTDFNISDENDPLFAKDISWKDIEEAIKGHVEIFLSEYLSKSREMLKKRLSDYAEKYPRYHAILGRIRLENLRVSCNSSDKELDLAFHGEYTRLEREILEEGHDLSVPTGINIDDYKGNIQEYLQKVEDIKKSDLTNYVVHRRVVLDLLRKAIGVQANDSYSREDLIHKLIFPMKKESSEVYPIDWNLWLIDERLAFHHFLSSDKSIGPSPVTESEDDGRPDIFVLNVYDNPLLSNEGEKFPLASITVVEFKRPMRNDASPGKDTDPIQQVLDYLDSIRSGKVHTVKGRPIPESDSIPAFCHIICDITSSIEKCCKGRNLTPTSDKMGFFGYNQNYNAYIEVISYDQLLNRAEERNRAFFDQLGLPNKE